MDALKKYFPTGTTEGDRHLLGQLFITPEQLPEVLSAPAGSPRLLVGNKGAGKSAILEWIFNAAKSKRIPTLFLRPDDLELSAAAGASDVGTIKRAMYECFLGSVADAIGQDLSGFLTGEAAELYQRSVASGARGADWMGKLLLVLSKLSKPVTQIDADQLATELAKPSYSKDRLVDVVQSHLFSQRTLFFILFDDTDQVADPDDPQHLNRIWGLLLAIRKLTSKSPNIRCIVTLRTEVWMRLTSVEQGQRDQIDHFRPLLMFLRAPDKLMTSIFKRRLQLAGKEVGFRGGGVLGEFFDGEWMTLPTSDARRTWEQFLLKSSRERPRDLIQLVHHLAVAAQARRSERIGAIDAEKAMETYSEERATDLAIEMGYDCASFLDVVRSFVDIDFEVDFETLRDHLKRVPSKFSLKVAGRTLRPDSDDDAVRLLSLIHESGLMNARVSDSTMPRGFRHITFLDDPFLVQQSRWNELQAATWEVHPAFRTYLLGLKKERANLTGRFA